MKSGASIAEVDTSAALILSLVSTVVLAALHLLAPRIRKLPLVPERVTASFAGGVAVAYVFLHLIPELGRGSLELRELFGETAQPSALVELGIFVVALVGLVIFYGLERLARRSRVERAGRMEGGRPTRGAGSQRVFYVHLGAFALYNAVITYTLPLNYRTGVAFAVLFTVAMGLHFVLSDRGLEENYGELFDRWPPRLLLAAALAGGWLLAWLFAPTSSITVSLLIAFLAGGVLMNVFKEEIPSGRGGSFGWFMVGTTVYAVLLLGVTVLEQTGGGEQSASALGGSATHNG
jgi:hypothetical protein